MHTHHTWQRQMIISKGGGGNLFSWRVESWKCSGSGFFEICTPLALVLCVGVRVAGWVTGLISSCVCVWERESERETKNVRACVCMRMHGCLHCNTYVPQEFVWPFWTWARAALAFAPKCWNVDGIACVHMVQRSATLVTLPPFFFQSLLLGLCQLKSLTSFYQCEKKKQGLRKILNYYRIFVKTTKTTGRTVHIPRT